MKLLEILKNQLEQDDNLGERTTMTSNEICDLVDLCVKSTYICFGDSFYEQIEGVSMGSPFLPLLANTSMESLEQEAIKTSPLKPSLQCRYVSDIFTLWPHNKKQKFLQEFKDHLNKQNKYI